MYLTGLQRPFRMLRMTTKRMAQQKRTVPGEKAGIALVDWLNQAGSYRGKKRTSAHKRISKLLDNLRLLMHGVWHRGPSTLTGESDDALLDDVQKQLSRYRMYPQIDERKTGNLGMRTVWTPGPSEEAKAVWIITWLGDRALLWAVRRCRRCGQWFYARRPKHFFHSTNCRVAYAQSTPLFRRQRAERVRRRRLLEREQGERFFRQLGTHQSKGKGKQ